MKVGDRLPDGTAKNQQDERGSPSIVKVTWVTNTLLSIKCTGFRVQSLGSLTIGALLALLVAGLPLDSHSSPWLVSCILFFTHTLSLSLMPTTLTSSPFSTSYRI